MRLKRIAIVLNGFVHDFTTGYWVAAMIAIGMLHRFQSQYPELTAQLNEIERFFFWNTVVSVVVILGTGAGRTFTYVDNVFGEQGERTRRKMLIIKHVVLLTIFGLGTWWGAVMSFDL